MFAASSPTEDSQAFQEMDGHIAGLLEQVHAATDELDRVPVQTWSTPSQGGRAHKLPETMLVLRGPPYERGTRVLYMPRVDPHTSC